MKVQQLGHVVLKVRERERSERFYTEVLGLRIAARRDTPPMTFFTLGNHHDFAIVALGADTPDSPANSPGLYHVAFKAGDSIDDLRRAKAHFDALGVPIDAIEDHVVAQSIYLHDPDAQRDRGVRRYLRRLAHRPASGCEHLPAYPLARHSPKRTPREVRNVSALQGEPFNQATMSAGEARAVAGPCWAGLGWPGLVHDATAAGA